MVNRTISLLDIAWIDTAEVLKRRDQFRKDNSFMSKLGKDIAALLVCLAIIIGAFFLLSYGRKHEVSAILTFGRVLDALVTTGIIANAIIFLLLMTGRFNRLRVALWSYS